MNSTPIVTLSLKFPLDIDDEWPPVSVESLPFLIVGAHFQVVDPPLFIKDLSVGDMLSVRYGPDNFVETWHHIQRSNRSTIWLLRLSPTQQIADALQRLRGLGCNTVGSESLGSYAIDVPETVPLSEVDGVLNDFDSEAVAGAFPSMRHPE